MQLIPAARDVSRALIVKNRREYHITYHFGPFNVPDSLALAFLNSQSSKLVELDADTIPACGAPPPADAFVG